MRGRAAEAHHSEAGFTLTEVLIALVILGVAITAIVAAMGTSILTADTHRKIVTDDAVVRSYGERLVSDATPYVVDADVNTAGYTPVGVNLNLGNWPGYNASLVNVECGSLTNPITFSPCSSGGDRGLQRITIEAHSNTNRGGNQRLQVVKRRP